MLATAQYAQTVIPNPIGKCSQAQLTPAYLQFTYIQALKQLVDIAERHHDRPAVRQEPHAAVQRRRRGDEPDHPVGLVGLVRLVGPDHGDRPLIGHAQWARRSGRPADTDATTQKASLLRGFARVRAVAGHSVRAPSGEGG